MPSTIVYFILSYYKVCISVSGLKNLSGLRQGINKHIHKILTICYFFFSKYVVPEGNSNQQYPCVGKAEKLRAD